MGLIPFPAQVPWSDISPWLGKPSQTFLQYLSSLDGIVRLIVSGGGSPRIVLSAPTTFYVATNGNDANNGLTSGTAWATLAHAIAVIFGTYDFGGQTVTLQAVAGHAAFTTNLAITTAWTGGGTFIFDGGGGSISSSATGLTTAAAIYIGATLPGPFTPQNVTLSASGASTTAMDIYLNADGLVDFGPGLVFGAASGLGQIYADNPGSFVRNLTNSYTINGDAAAHIEMVGGAFAQFFPPAVTLSPASTRVFSRGFAVATLGSVIQYASTAPFSGGVGGAASPRFSVDQNGVISAGGQGVNYFPGNAAGVFPPPTGGQYG